MMGNYLNYISLAITIISICMAFWQFWSRRKLKDFILLDAMELYRDTGIMLGAVQQCIESIQKNDLQSANSAAGRTEGMAQALFQRSIKNIQFHFKYSKDTVERWIEDEKINEHHKSDFLKYAK